MNNRWLQAPLWLRIVSFCALTLLSLILLWQLWLQPATQQAERLEQQFRQQNQYYHSRLQPLLALPALSLLKQQIAQSERELHSAATARFSLPALLTASGGLFVHWQPTKSGGELALSLRWSQFTDLLTYLAARRPVVVVPRFTLQSEQPLLRLILELSDES